MGKNKKRNRFRNDKSGPSSSAAIQFHTERSMDEGKSSWSHSRNPHRGGKEWRSQSNWHQRKLNADRRQHRDDHASSSKSSTEQDYGGSDIPGFYYDEEKKAYFKILPNSFSSVSSFVTKENIQKKEKEKQRKIDVDKLHARQYFVPGALDRSLADVLGRFQCGQVTCSNFRNYMIRHQCHNLKPVMEIKGCGPQNNSIKLGNLEKMITTQNRDHLLCVWSLKSSLAQCIQLLSVASYFCQGKTRLRERLDLSTEAILTPSYHPNCIQPVLTLDPLFKKISSVCWVQNLPQDEGTYNILYTAHCPIGYSHSIVYICNLNKNTGTTTNLFELSLGLSTVWSSAWHSSQAKFSIGSERKCHLIDVATRRTWSFFTQSSDPLAQVFSQTDPHRLYSGTRGGSIILHDLRCPGKISTQGVMREKHGIGCLRLMRDDNYIMASYFSGEIASWDQRVGRIVQKYEGQKNSHYQLPFHLDEQETVVCGAGSDCYSRLWDVRSSTLLHSIPPNCPAVLESFPIAVYSQAWGNSGGNSGLIVGNGDNFSIYQ